MSACITRSISSRSNALSLLFRPNISFVYYSSRAHPNPETFLFRPDKVEIIGEFRQNLEAKKVKYRRHPGILNISVQRVETDIQKAIGSVLIKGGDVAMYKTQGKEVERRLQNRRLPLEIYDVAKLRFDIERRLRESQTKKGLAPENFETKEDRLRFEERVQKTVDRRLEMSIYKWNAMEYNSPSKCMTYCVMRFAPEYAALRRVFNEIVKREPNFKPRHILDFGSGVGTTFFAAETTWPDSAEEYFCVDSSQDMNDLFHLLLRNGQPEHKPRHPNVTFRSFLPATAERQFDVVVSAYSLFELPSYEERMRVVANLWLKTKNFLVLIERGSNAGFRAIVEARDYILAGAHELYRGALAELAEKANVDTTEVKLILKRKDVTEAEKFRLLRERYPDVEFPTLLPHGHVFAPCPHDMGCPRLMDVTPCNFAVRYFPLRFSGGEEVPQQEVFSFIILRRGYAPSADRWPRIVREPRKSVACIWCQMCSPHGVLEDKAFHSGQAGTERGKQFRLVKRSSWGDLLPVVTSYEANSTSTSAAKAQTASEADHEDELDQELDEDEDEEEFGENVKREDGRSPKEDTETRG